MEESSASMALGEFLRSRRERLTPEEVGLVAYGRRRTAGLRREEVAMLAHIGTSWYTSLEQGRSVHPSEEVLDNLAAALRLTEDERRHLHLLAKPTKRELAGDQELDIGMKRLLEALEPNPAFAMGRHWNLLDWNEPAEVVFGLPSAKAADQRPHWLRRFLTDSTVRSRTSQWEAKARMMIAHFRADYARYPDDARFRALIEEFIQTSELFRESWPLHDVQVITDCRKLMSDPRIGELEFEHVTLQPPGNPDQTIMIYTASADTAARLKKFMDARAKEPAPCD